MGSTWSCLFRLGRNLRDVGTALPIAKVFLRQIESALPGYITNQNHRRIFGTVETVKEFPAVVVLVRHIFNVFDEPHRGVRVGVLLERGFSQAFEQLSNWCGAVLVVLAFNGQRFGAK